MPTHLLGVLITSETDISGITVELESSNIIVYKLSVLDRNTWNYITLCELLVLKMVIWSYNYLQMIVICLKTCNRLQKERKKERTYFGSNLMPTNLLTNQPTNQLTIKQISRPASKLANQPTNQPAKLNNQQNKQITNQPTNQPTKQTNHKPTN